METTQSLFEQVSSIEPGKGFFLHSDTLMHEPGEAFARYYAFLVHQGLKTIEDNSSAALAGVHGYLLEQRRGHVTPKFSTVSGILPKKIFPSQATEGRTLTVLSDKLDIMQHLDTHGDLRTGLKLENYLDVVFQSVDMCLSINTSEASGYIKR